MWAAYKGYEEIVALLLEKGADVHAHGNFNIKYVRLPRKISETSSACGPNALNFNIPTF